MSGTLIGRDDELASLSDFLGKLGDGSAGFVIVGDAGIGKTTLWSAAVETARSRGIRVLTSAPAEAESRLSFGALGDLLGEALVTVRDDLPAPQRHALDVALLLDDPSDTALEERAVAVAFLSALTRLARVGPVLLAIDDVQWLDAPSASVLTFVARRLGDARIGFLLSQRLDVRVPLSLERARLRAPLTALVMRPLSIGALRRILHDQLGAAFPRPVVLKLHAVSGGNPFFAVELARALDRMNAPLGPGGSLPVPTNLQELLRERIGSLWGASSDLLLAAAALSNPTIRLLEAAAPGNVAAQLDAAIAADVLAVTGGSVRFTHPLLASAVYSMTGPLKRRAFHRRLATLVEDLEERARHLALASDGPDAQVARTLEEAAVRAVARGALSAAAELAELALTLTPVDRTTEAHGRRIQAATQHYASGNTAHAVELLDPALINARPGHARAELLWTLGTILADSEDPRAAHDLYRRAAAEPEVRDELRARIFASRASLQMEGAEEAREHARLATDLAQRVGDTSTLALALAKRAAIAFFSGESFERDLIEQALTLEGSPGRLGIARGPSLICAELLTFADRLELARPLLERLYELGQQRGDVAVTGALVLLTAIEIDSGNYVRAESLARELYDLAEQGERKVEIARAMTLIADVAALRGDVKAAREMVGDALLLTQARGLQSRGPRATLGRLELSLENYQAAYEALVPAIERNRTLGVRAPFRQTADGAEALTGLGRLEEAEQLIAPFEAAAHGLDITWAIVAGARARGLIAAARGDLDVAQEILAAGLARAEHNGRPLDEGRTLLALGSVRRRAKHRRLARETLQRAHAVFARIGAVLWAERARSELERISGRAPAEHGLSPSERRVAQLVAEGRSNKQVAAALFVSPKTVDVTLSRIYAKTGVHSRTMLARRLAAEGGSAKL